jgi:hypothetical protein
MTQNKKLSIAALAVFMGISSRGTRVRHRSGSGLSFFAGQSPILEFLFRDISRKSTGGLSNKPSLGASLLSMAFYDDDTAEFQRGKKLAFISG